MSRPVETDDDTTRSDLASLCLEAGWSFEPRSDGALVVDLGVSGTYVSALVEAHASGISVEATLLAPLPESGARLAALGALFVRANASFRMVRALSRGQGDASRAVLEAPLPIDASATDLDFGLGAVAIAARHCAVEVQSLARDEGLACLYLERCGGIGRIDPDVGLMRSPTVVVG